MPAALQVEFDHRIERLCALSPQDAATAIAKLQEALRGLMYVVLLTSVDPDILGG